MFKESRGAPKPVGRETRRAGSFGWLCHVDAPVLSYTMGLAAIDCLEPGVRILADSYLQRLQRLGSKPARSHERGLPNLQRAEFFALPVLDLNSFY